MSAEQLIEKWSKYLEPLTDNEKAPAARCLENQAQWLLTSNDTGVDPDIILTVVAATLIAMRGNYMAADLPVFIDKDGATHVCSSLNISNSISRLFQNIVDDPLRADVNLFGKTLAEEYFRAAPDRLLVLYTPLCIYPLHREPNDSGQKFGMSYRSTRVKK